MHGRCNYSASLGWAMLNPEKDKTAGRLKFLSIAVGLWMVASHLTSLRVVSRMLFLLETSLCFGGHHRLDHLPITPGSLS